MGHDFLPGCFCRLHRTIRPMGGQAITIAQRAVKEGMDLKWANLFMAVDSGRRLLTHHYPEAFTGDGEDRLEISMLVTLAVEASKRPETNCSRNGLFLMGNMLRYVEGVTGTTGPRHDAESWSYTVRSVMFGSALGRPVEQGITRSRIC